MVLKSFLAAKAMLVSLNRNLFQLVFSASGKIIKAPHNRM